jgi:hypothetical protein
VGGVDLNADTRSIPFNGETIKVIDGPLTVLTERLK